MTPVDRSVQMVLICTLRAGVQHVALNGHAIGAVRANSAGQWYSLDADGNITSAGHPSVHSAMLDLAQHYLTKEIAS